MVTLIRMSSVRLCSRVRNASLIAAASLPRHAYTDMGATCVHAKTQIILGHGETSVAIKIITLLHFSPFIKFPFEDHSKKSEEYYRGESLQQLYGQSRQRWVVFMINILCQHSDQVISMTPCKTNITAA